MSARNILVAVAALLCATLSTGLAVGPAMAGTPAAVSEVSRAAD